MISGRKNRTLSSDNYISKLGNISSHTLSAHNTGPLGGAETSRLCGEMLEGKGGSVWGKRQRSCRATLEGSAEWTLICGK